MGLWRLIFLLFSIKPKDQKTSISRCTRMLARFGPDLELRHLAKGNDDSSVTEAKMDRDPNGYSKENGHYQLLDEEADKYDDVDEDGYLSGTPSEKLIAEADRIHKEKTPLIHRRKKRHLKKFYSGQRSFIYDYKKDQEVLDAGEGLNEDGTRVQDPQDAIDEKKRSTDEILAKITFGLNLILLVLKIVASVLSRSLSVVSTVIDSAVDLCSGLAIWLTLRAIDKNDPYEYPRGRNKLEPLSVIIVSIIMGVANIVMIIQSVELLVEGNINPNVDAITIAILLTGTTIKIILLYFCSRQGTTSSKVLAADQRNDIITNLVALSCALIGHYLWLYMDPLGAIIVCSYIAGSWFYMAADQIPYISGKVASPDLINRIIRVCINHDPRIKCLDTILAYHYGTNLLVELHVVLDPDMSLRESHDITQPLQEKLERLPYVERAFVHCDYELDGVNQ